MNFGRVHLPFKRFTPYLPYFQSSENIEDYTPTLGLSKLIDLLEPHFSFPRTELTRFANCLFHEILATVKRGRAVSIPYFGKFIGSMITSKKVFNVAFNQHITPRIIQRCHPILLPSKYAVMVCSAKTAFNAPLFFVSSLSALKSPSSLYSWYESQQKFMKRNLMLFDNPYPLMGDVPKYKLKESTSYTILNETDLKEFKDMEKAVIQKSWDEESQLVKKHVLKDFYGKGKCLCVSYNYLPGTYYRGLDYNSDMQEKELKKNLTRYEVLSSRSKKLKIKKLPLKVPKDFSWNFFDHEGKGFLHEEQLRKDQVTNFRRLSRKKAEQANTTVAV